MPSTDLQHIARAVALALEAEAAGNLPVGALLVLDGERVAEGRNAVLRPHYDPGRHAEIEAIRALAPALWPRAREMTLYTTLEPCMMCMGAVLLHGIGRVVYGAPDLLGGCTHSLAHLPPYYAKARVPEFHGPIDDERCRALYERVARAFAELPCA
ncbi:MAG: nucleoside deaminase [Myxococcota bacterium]|jgi:tRNA(adenine34) deaminase|nr:nucleoside deaminase [Myxococcota bacterium]